MSRRAKHWHGSTAALQDGGLFNGYVERVADPLDGRAQRVRATERGLEVTHLVRRIARQIETDWGQLIGKEQLEQLKRLLGALVDAVRRAEPDASAHPA